MDLRIEMFWMCLLNVLILFQVLVYVHLADDLLYSLPCVLSNLGTAAQMDSNRKGVKQQ